MIIMTKLVTASVFCCLLPRARPWAPSFTGISPSNLGPGAELPLGCKPTGRLCLFRCVEELCPEALAADPESVSTSPWNPNLIPARRENGER